jgi:hypothetical protein
LEFFSDIALDRTHTETSALAIYLHFFVADALERYLVFIGLFVGHSIRLLRCRFTLVAQVSTQWNEPKKGKNEQPWWNESYHIVGVVVVIFTFILGEPVLNVVDDVHATLVRVYIMLVVLAKCT